MNFPTTALRNIRAFAMQLADGLSDEDLNTIPPGFKNNIIWNLGHLVAAEQGVLYVRGGATPRVATDFLKKYTRGTKPEHPAGSDEIATIKALLSSTLPMLDVDIESGVFSGYKAWTTPYGIELTSIEDALQFLLFHEGIHCGYIMALKRAIDGGR